MLRTQLRAILRAGDSGRLKVMFPMVSDLEEWRSARTLLEEARAECGSPAIEAGIMVEVPSCALLAEAFAPEVDFFSIGTNDLTQYTLAADRSEASLRAVADGLHPAVLRLIHQTVSSAHAAGKSVTVCGELAADAQAIPVLVGIGVDALSVSPSAIPAVAWQLRQLTLPSARQLAERALASQTAADVRNLVVSG
jgi:phosphocarrier protein FPr